MLHFLLFSNLVVFLAYGSQQIFCLINYSLNENNFPRKNNKDTNIESVQINFRWF